MVWRYIKKWRDTPEGHEQKVHGRGTDAFEKAKATEESAEGDKPRSDDVLVEEEAPERAAPPRGEEEERYYEEEEEEEEESLGGVFISDKKVRGGFKKFGISLLSLFLLPWLLAFGIAVLALVSLVVFPIAMSLFPIFLVALFILVVVAPLLIPLLIIYLLVTEHGRLLINSEGKRFWFSFPPAERLVRERFRTTEEPSTGEDLEPEEHPR